MSYSVLKGRLRSIPLLKRNCNDHLISCASSTLPEGTLTIHILEHFNCNIEEYRCQSSKLYNLKEVHRSSKNEAIIDHVWSILGVKMLLTVLSRCNGYPEKDEKNICVIATHIRIYEQIYEDGGGTRLMLLVTIPLNLFANSLVLHENIMVVGTSLGAWVYNLYELFHDDNIECIWRKPAKVLLFTSYVAHCLYINPPFFVAASGDRLGVWEIKSLLKEKEEGLMPVAVWTTKLNDLHSHGRVTSIVMLHDHGDDDKLVYGKLMAISCWDGSAYVFERQIKEEQEPSWEKLCPSNMKKNESWEIPTVKGEESAFPTYATIINCTPYVNDFMHYYLLISTPGSSIIRCFDLYHTRPCSKLGKRAKCSWSGRYCDTQGIISVKQQISCLSQSWNSFSTSRQYIIWIDNRDFIHIQKFPFRDIIGEKVIGDGVSRGLNLQIIHDKGKDNNESKQKEKKNS